jgi:hypothetical protein
MGKVDETVVREEGTQGGIPPPPGADTGRQGPHGPAWPAPPPPGYYPPYGGWYAPPPQAYGPAQPPRRSGKPKIVGILLIFSGVLSIIMGGFFGAMMYNIVPWMDQMSSNSSGVGEIEGMVIFMDSTPAAGVNITVSDLGLVAITDATGSYRILNVANGWHDLKIEMAGFKTLVKSVYVNIMNADGTGMSGPTGGVTKADFQLQPGSGEQRIGETHKPGSKTIPMDRNAQDILRSMGAVCMVLGVVLGTFAILGGYFALRTERLGIVALGALCGLLSFGFAIGSGLALIALILLLLSTDEFERAKKEREAGQ